MPAPMRGLRSAGMTGRTGSENAAGSLSADDRASLDGGGGFFVDRPGFAAVVETERLLSGCGAARGTGVETVLVDGWRRLLWDPLGWRLVVCGRRRGRGIEAWRDTDDSGIWPADAFAEPFEDADCVLSRGKGSDSGAGAVFADGIFRLVRDGMRRAAVGAAERPGPVLLYVHDPASSSPTGVRGIATLEPDTLEGVAIPVSSLMLSASCSRM